MHKQWWKGERGEWYVVAQMLLIALVVFGPTAWPSAPAWPWATVWRWMGAAFVATGTLLAIFATLRLGASLTPLPHPKDDSRLVVAGAYRLVRHPIYSGIVLAALGWALWSNGWLTLGYALLLFLFFDVKSRREEQWLLARYPEYRAYRQRVKKLIPLLY